MSFGDDTLDPATEDVATAKALMDAIEQECKDAEEKLATIKTWWGDDVFGTIARIRSANRLLRGVVK